MGKHANGNALSSEEFDSFKEAPQTVASLSAMRWRACVVVREIACRETVASHAHSSISCAGSVRPSRRE